MPFLFAWLRFPYEYAIELQNWFHWVIIIKPLSNKRTLINMEISFVLMMSRYLQILESFVWSQPEGC